MAFRRQTGETSPQESITFTYWLTILHLLKLGIAWEAIHDFTEDEINLILGVQSALDQREADEQTRQMARSGGMPSIM